MVFGMDMIFLTSKIYWYVDLTSFLVNSMRRETNFVVHSLTRYARYISTHVFWIDDSTPLALKALYFDLVHF